MAKLSKAEWKDVRKIWESDPRDGFDWLVKELKLEATRQAASALAKRQGWSKSNKNNVAKQNNVAVNVAKQNKATKKAITKRTDNKSENKTVGRPTSYKEEYNEQGYRLCLLGAVDKELADFFGVDESTINNWKLSQPGFLESIRNGKVTADTNVANSLYKSAVGDHVLTEDRVITGIDGQEVVTLEKQVPSDYRAQSLWLRNRRPKDWREKVEVDTNFKLDKELLETIETKYIEVMAKAHERQRQVLIERGIIIEHEK